MTTGRLPPHDLDAEAAVLSALLLDPKRIIDVDLIVTPEDFFSHANRAIARAIWELDAAGTSIDVVTIASHLHASGGLGQVGGTPYLAQITDAIPAVAHVADHARAVAMAARIRHVIAACQVVAGEGYSAPPEPGEWLESAAARVTAACDGHRFGPDSISLVADTVPQEYEKLLDRSRTRATPGRSTRLGPLDKILGGLIDSVPYILAARPGHGKTALAWQIAEAIASRGDLAIFLSQEMPRPQLTLRGIAQAANVEMRSLQRGLLTSGEWDAVATAVHYSPRLPIAIDDKSAHTPHSMRSSVRRCMQRLRQAGHTGELGIIVIDYLQIMAGSSSRRDTRSTEVADNMRAVTQLAKECRCPVLALSQLNREIERRPDKRPKLSDLGESGALEADAYAVMFIYRQDVYREVEKRDGLADIIVAKNRNGRTGTATVRFMPSTLFAPTGVDMDEFDDFASDARYAGDAA